MGFAFVHKTLAFATGAAVAGVGFMVLNDQILFSHNRIYNKMIAASQTAQETDMETYPESKDYYEDAIRGVKRTWNRSINWLYELGCKQLQSEEPFSQRLQKWYAELRHRGES
ncbi:hypothetical protein WA588_004760, partial [Blastocystis sp. NMH]